MLIIKRLMNQKEVEVGTANKKHTLFTLLTFFSYQFGRNSSVGGVDYNELSVITLHMILLLPKSTAQNNIIIKK